MNFFRAVWRSLRLMGLFVVFGTELAVRRPKTRALRADWLHRFCAQALKQLDFCVSVAGQFPEKGALISNHLSYLDIVVFAAVHPCVFVSKEEIRSWPVVGWMTTMSGAVYVARGHGGSAVRARRGMQEALDAGLPVVFFPEGTTSDGSGLLKFHSGLLGQVLAGGAPVTAAFVQYSLTGRNDPQVKVADHVCYWGDGSMWKHVFKLLGLHGVQAEVRFADDPIVFSSVSLHRKRAALEAQDAVASLRHLNQPRANSAAGAAAPRLE